MNWSRAITTSRASCAFCWLSSPDKLTALREAIDSSSIAASCLFRRSMTVTARIAVFGRGSVKRSLLVFIEVLASWTLRRISTIASRTAWLMPSLSPCSSTFLAAPKKASTPPGGGRKRGDESGDREPANFCRRL
ncbi:hypothetical protein RRF57_007705 [Xylaria bambusicola]|uniref:Uncharacterized protein n=1 Tax=Xylaria bambusicola TaxID=326684 RepID=A0AAN7UU52_9PEZI